MKIKPNHCRLLLFIVIAFASCDTPRYYIYSPTPPVSPFFKEKGDSKLSAYMSAVPGSQAPGIDLQAGYAVTDHLAVTGAYSSRRERDRYDWSDWDYGGDSIINSYKRRLGEIGAGYFTKMNRKGNATFNLYGGFSWGKFSFKETGKNDMGERYARNYEAGLRKWYIQPSLHFMPGRVFRLGIGTRFSFINYDNIQADYTWDEASTRSLNEIPDKTFFYLEPALNFQFAFPEKWVKLDFGLTFCPSYNSVYDESNLRHRWINASLGLTFDLTKINND